MTTARKRFLLSAVAALLLVPAGAMLSKRWRAPGIPTAEVKRKEFVEYQSLRGEVKAKRSIAITAPFEAGDLQILNLAKTGTTVRKGDIVVQFDLTPVRVAYEQKQSMLQSADAQIRQSKARARMEEEQRKTDMLKAEYNVQRARLDARKQEILSEIEAQKTALALADRRQKFHETEVRVGSSRESGKADSESFRLKRDKVLFELEQARRQMESLTLRAPVDGVISLLPNLRASAGRMSPAPEFRPGDRAWPGASVAEIPDASSLRVIVRVDEIDRGRIALNQSALIHVDAVPDRDFTAVVAEISTLGKPDFSTFPPPRNFEVILEIQDRDPRLRPGMMANARIILSRIADAIVVPSDAVFEKNGLTVVYVRQGSGFEERTVTVGNRSNSECLISSGLHAGEHVAIKDPRAEDSSRK